MAKFQKVKGQALQPIPRVVDNSDAMAIKQLALTNSVRIKRTDKIPANPYKVPPGVTPAAGWPGITK